MATIEGDDFIEKANQTDVGIRRKETRLDKHQFPLHTLYQSIGSLLVVLILGLACIAAFMSRLFAVIRFESIIHEFDPWCVLHYLRYVNVRPDNVYIFSIPGLTTGLLILWFRMDSIIS